MAIIEKTLQGVVRIDADGEYQLVVPKKSGTALPNGLDNQVIEEVYVIIESTDGPITPVIYLPRISTFNNAWNAKIYIVNKDESDKIIAPRPVSEGETQDYINQIGITGLAVKNIAYFHVVDNDLWACWQVANS